MKAWEFGIRSTKGCGVWDGGRSDCVGVYERREVGDNFRSPGGGMETVRSTIRDMGYGRGHVRLCMFVYAGKGRSANPPFTHGQSRLRGVTLCGHSRVYLPSQTMQENRFLTSIPWYSN